ncbi:DUF2793 domain-containing protein [Sphingomonas aerophila]|jgi:hypothetical protein|uniref:DUF2793 domain-containing protein n=1 Tax=Sphingomonas aerophila TaxID=1344948 RepID=A0A7W9BGN7_9SPHN|nr:DUF2793 domain-containing protein [Sphingomonas aerophila]MBB5716594.1 hypothetical protein [Sphingomonas aerophila]
MSNVTARLGLPMLEAGQAQKELTHNEALATIDLAVWSSVEGAERNDPPAEPTAGKCWLVGSAPTGAWSGMTDAIAGWTAGGWRFILPVDGMSVWDSGRKLTWRWSGAAWKPGEVTGTRLILGGTQVVGAQGTAIAAPAGGNVADTEARLAVVSILAALRLHGLIAP